MEISAVTDGEQPGCSDQKQYSKIDSPGLHLLQEAGTNSLESSPDDMCYSPDPYSSDMYKDAVEWAIGELDNGKDDVDEQIGEDSHDEGNQDQSELSSNDDNLSSDEPITMDYESSTVFKCRHCIKSMGILASQIIGSHVSLYTRLSLFCCPLCPKTFPESIEFDDHLTSHCVSGARNTINCHGCGYQYLMLYSLDDTEQNVLNEDPEECIMMEDSEENISIDDPDENELFYDPEANDLKKGPQEPDLLEDPEKRDVRKNAEENDLKDDTTMNAHDISGSVPGSVPDVTITLKTLPKENTDIDWREKSSALIGNSNACYQDLNVNVLFEDPEKIDLRAADHISGSVPDVTITMKTLPTGKMGVDGSEKSSALIKNLMACNEDLKVNIVFQDPEMNDLKNITSNITKSVSNVAIPSNNLPKEKIVDNCVEKACTLLEKACNEPKLPKMAISLSKKSTTGPLKENRRGNTPTCPVCNKVFTTKYYLGIHMRIHTGEKPYACDQCEKTFYVRSHLKSHKLVHENEKITCTVCGKILQSNQTLRIHMRTHNERPYSCDTCGKGFCTKTQLNYHMDNHDNSKYPCDECDEVLNTRRNLKYHKFTHQMQRSQGAKKLPEERQSPDSSGSSPNGKSELDVNDGIGNVQLNSVEKAYTCEVCLKSFRTKALRRSHMLTHRDDCKVTCKVCGKVLRTKQTFAIHMRTHDEKRRFSCEVCGKGFCTSNQLKLHSETHGDYKYTCGICNESFKTKRSFKTHNKRNHLKDSNIICPICGKSYITESFGTHMEIHNNVKPYSCDVCKKDFRTQYCLNVHYRVHTQERPHVCDSCGKQFKTTSALVRHQKIHDYPLVEDYPFMCTFCGKKFLRKGQLDKHILLHTGEKPFKCPTCGKTFRLRHNLTVHQRIHSGEKPYTCDLCHHMFTTLSGMRAHRETHMRIKDKVCLLCGKRFYQDYQLERHVRRAHKPRRTYKKRKLEHTTIDIKDGVGEHYEANDQPENVMIMMMPTPEMDCEEDIQVC